MSTIEKKVDALVQLFLCETPEEKEAIIKSLREMVGKAEFTTPATPVNYHDKVTKALLEIGLPDHIKGHKYSAYAIEYVINNPKSIEQVTCVIYPEVAKKFETTASRVERAIRHAIEVSWDRASLDALNKYFGNTVSPSKGKPTNSEFLARMANELR